MNQPMIHLKRMKVLPKQTAKQKRGKVPTNLSWERGKENLKETSKSSEPN